MKIDLTKPAFGDGSQKMSEIEPKEAPAEAPQAEPEKVADPASDPVKPVGVPEEEQKVPYSRFKKFHDEAVELRKKIAELNQPKDEPIKPAAEEPDADLPQEWAELYGDSDASKKAYKVELARQERLATKIQERALEAVRNERLQEENRTKENLETIDNRFEDLSALVGRDLSEKEQSAVLDVVDEYTPKDEDGNYLGEMMSFDKAWEIYNLKNKVAEAPKKQSRDAVAQLTGSQTQGKPSDQLERDKNFNPLNWNAYQDRL